MSQSIFCLQGDCESENEQRLEGIIAVKYINYFAIKRYYREVAIKIHKEILFENMARNNFLMLFIV